MSAKVTELLSKSFVDLTQKDLVEMRQQFDVNEVEPEADADRPRRETLENVESDETIIEKSVNMCTALRTMEITTGAFTQSFTL